MGPSHVLQLVEEGIKAYTRGRVHEAEKAWRDALELDPFNERARMYLELVGATVPAPPTPAPRSASWTQGPTGTILGMPSPLAAPPPAAPPAPGAPGRTLFGQPPAPEPVPGSAGRTLFGQPSPPLASSPSDPWAAAAGAEPLAPPAPAGPSAFDADPFAAPPADLSAHSPWDEGPALSSSIEISHVGGLDLTAVDEKSEIRPLVPERPAHTPIPRGPRSDVDVWMDGAKELHALGDFSGSLEMVEKILKLDPNHVEARQYLKENEETLVHMYESKLGPQEGRPQLAIKPEEVMWLNLDHRAGFLLAQIDGTVSYEDLFAVSGLPRLDTARILATLLHDGVIKSA